MTEIEEQRTLFDYLCSLIKELPPEERAVLNEIAINQTPSDIGIAKRLLMKGLVERDRESVPGSDGRIEYIYFFEIPVSIHAAWCAIKETGDR